MLILLKIIDENKYVHQLKKKLHVKQCTTRPCNQIEGAKNICIMQIVSSIQNDGNKTKMRMKIHYIWIIDFSTFFFSSFFFCSFSNFSSCNSLLTVFHSSHPIHILSFRVKSFKSNFQTIFTYFLIFISFIWFNIRKYDIHFMNACLCLCECVDTKDLVKFFHSFFFIFKSQIIASSVWRIFMNRNSVDLFNWKSHGERERIKSNYDFNFWICMHVKCVHIFVCVCVCSF